MDRGRSTIPWLRHSLRARVAITVALPLMLALTSLSIAHYLRGRNLVESQVRTTAGQLGQILAGSLRRAMLSNDNQLITAVLQDVGDVETIDRVRIVDGQGVVRLDSRTTDLGLQEHTDRPGCAECHVYDPASRPRAVLLTGVAGILRIASPIDNEPACLGCHADTQKHLGVVLADVPVLALEQDLLRDLEIDLAISVGITLLVTVGVYLLIHRSVVRRVEGFLPALASFSDGDFSARLPESGRAQDELGQLAVAFNQMAEDVERHTRDRAEQSMLRQRAIVEERERIARELHDGIAQLLGFVNNKAMAVRLLLKKDRTRAADHQLRQLEEASHSAFIDVREAILGLRTTDRAGVGLSSAIEDYVHSFSRLTGISVDLTLGRGVRQRTLDAEVEVQLLRIVQEGLTNIRKHAAARRATVSLHRDQTALELEITDRGTGFVPGAADHDQTPRFGLSTMQERAESIGATLELASAPGAGTRISVVVPLGRS